MHKWRTSSLPIPPLHKARNFSSCIRNMTPFLARTVVLAVGTASNPSIPGDCRLGLNMGQPSVCHCFKPNGTSHLPEHVVRKIHRGEPTSIVVVGGGLTSAQIVDRAIRSGIRQVWLVLRGKYKLKHFDVDLEWVSKLRNQQMAEFCSAESDKGKSYSLVQKLDSDT